MTWARCSSRCSNKCVWSMTTLLATWKSSKRRKRPSNNLKKSCLKTRTTPSSLGKCGRKTPPCTRSARSLPIWPAKPKESLTKSKRRVTKEKLILALKMAENRHQPITDHFHHILRTPSATRRRTSADWLTRSWSLQTKPTRPLLALEIPRTE